MVSGPYLKIKKLASSDVVVEGAMGLEAEMYESNATNKMYINR